MSDFNSYLQSEVGKKLSDAQAKFIGELVDFKQTINRTNSTQSGEVFRAGVASHINRSREDYAKANSSSSFNVTPKQVGLYDKVVTQLISQVKAYEEWLSSEKAADEKLSKEKENVLKDKSDSDKKLASKQENQIKDKASSDKKLALKQENQIKDEAQPSTNKAPKASLFAKIRLDAMAANVIDSLASSATSYSKSNVQASMMNIQSNTGMSGIIGAIGQQFENSASIKQSLGSAIGAVIGGTIGGLTTGVGGALIGSQLGSGVGGYVGSLLGNNDLVRGEKEKLKASQIQYSYFDSTMSQRYADSALGKNPLTAKFEAGDKEITMSGKSSLGLDKLSNSELQYTEQILAARRAISGKHDTSISGGYATKDMARYSQTLDNMGINPSQQPRMMAQFAQLTKNNDKTLGDQVARGAEYYVKYGELTTDKLDMVIALTRQGLETDKAYSLVGQSQLGNTGAQDKIAFDLQDPATKMVSSAILSSMGLTINNVLENGFTDAQLKEITGKDREGAIADIMNPDSQTPAKFLFYQALGGQGTINALNNTNKGIAQEGMKTTVDSNGNIITPSSLASQNPAESAVGKAIDIVAKWVDINNPANVSINGVNVSKVFGGTDPSGYAPQSPSETIRQLYQGSKVGSTAMSTGKQ